jgi:TRAP-type C4-dicarboxylate transport system permease small subunit
MKTFGALKNGVKKMNMLLGSIGILMIFATMFMNAYDVVGRALRKPFLGNIEISQVVLGVMILLGLGYVQTEKAHISIDFVFKRLPRWTQKTLDIVTPLLCLSLASLAAWVSIDFVMDAKASGEYTDNLRIPIWLFKLSMPLGFFALSCQLILDAADAVLQISHGSRGA